jgi:hypothetical protein
MRKGIAAGLAAAALAAGCNIVPTKAYEGPARNRDELSVIKGGASGEEQSPVSLVDLRAIDGARQREGTYLVSVLPGRHSIALSQTLRIGVATRTQFCAFDLEALAGCRYVPRPPSPPSDARAGRNAIWEWSVDMPVAAECIAGDYQVRVPARCGSSMKLLESSKP